MTRFWNGGTVGVALTLALMLVTPAMASVPWSNYTLEERVSFLEYGALRGILPSTSVLDAMRAEIAKAIETVEKEIKWQEWNGEMLLSASSDSDLWKGLWTDHGRRLAELYARRRKLLDLQRRVDDLSKISPTQFWHLPGSGGLDRDTGGGSGNGGRGH